MYIVLCIIIKSANISIMEMKHFAFSQNLFLELYISYFFLSHLMVVKMESLSISHIHEYFVKFFSFFKGQCLQILSEIELDLMNLYLLLISVYFQRK